ncbi:TPA: hypothetical protein N0F65_010473 [Lagenidium giganteum]|uniref:CCHC-type domain-containing protein n=1 Tax=Lagenidium giganteum TaxID=4803 RepID=A0AAV2YFU2_9STRA|nr:TPA: hypothetical protein N0F65_010473 [Lagenidium giganteum]
MVTIFVEGLRQSPARLQLFRKIPSTLDEAIRIAFSEEYSHRSANGNVPIPGDGACQSGSLYEYVDSCYFVASIGRGYEVKANGAIELILDSNILSNPHHCPPPLEKRKGRPRVRRLASQGENQSSGKRPCSSSKPTCSMCGLVGHNKRTCRD